MPTLVLNDVSVRYDGQPRRGRERRLARRRHRRFRRAAGRSGCGKTTLLNVAAGFIAPSHGDVTVDGVPITGPGADRAVVFQNDALFPWLTCARQRRLPAEAARRARGRARRPRRCLLSRVKLDMAGGKAIWELSGGMRQRVGLARALAADPRLPADGRAARRARRAHARAHADAAARPLGGATRSAC